jgi:predicted nucleic acid-binding protein
MTCSSFLADTAETIILDTSVIINLHACGLGERILATVPNPVVLPQAVIGELERESKRSDAELAFAKGLVDRQIAELAWLDEHSFGIFERLISGSPSLGDGEAATIALASSKNAVPVIDERKGRNRAAALLSMSALPWSLDLLIHPALQAVFTEAERIEMLYDALRNGRMRIDDGRCDAVASFIGIQRALQCSSLPNFKTRRNIWLAQQSAAMTA